jgi:hypothetical protein
LCDRGTTEGCRNDTACSAAAAAAAAGHLPFSGKSFKNLLLAGGRKARRARRGTALASQQQQDRFLFSLSPICWDPDSVPDLDADRCEILFTWSLSFAAAVCKTAMPNKQLLLS